VPQERFQQVLAYAIDAPETGCASTRDLELGPRARQWFRDRARRQWFRDRARDLITHLLVVAPKGRYSATDAIKHPRMDPRRRRRAAARLQAAAARRCARARVAAAAARSACSRLYAQRSSGATYASGLPHVNHFAAPHPLAHLCLSPRGCRRSTLQPVWID
jgi:hypothetical protein